jgi:hypothetical protein
VNVPLSPASSRLLKAALAIALLVGMATSASNAAAAPLRERDCAKAVIDDWYGDGQVDGRYPTRCYRAAIKSLHTDQKDYTHASEDILRALSYRKQGKPDPGNGAQSALLAQSLTATSHEPGIPPVGLEATDETLGVGPDGELGGSNGSLPIPLLVLGGLAIILLGAGGSGYVTRRLQARRDDDNAS